MKPDLGKLLATLLESKIDFVLIGGFAGTLHGSTVVTQDLDVCLLLDPTHIKRLRTILAPFHPKHRMTPQKLSFLTELKSLENINNLYLETDLGILDIISSVTGVGGFEMIHQRAVKVPLYGYTCKVISIDDLIAAKGAMGRDKDKLAIRELTVIKDRKKT